MATSRDYYEILGINKSASDPEIKAAYRKQALLWHPDRNKSKDATDKFKEINEAYEVLSDSEKRSTYDQFGHSAFQPGGGFDQGGARTYQQGPFTYTYTNYGGDEGSSPFEGGFDFGGFSDPFEIFEQFFGGASPFASAGRSRRQRQIPRYGLAISFMEAVKGTTKTVRIDGEVKTIKIPAGVDDGTRIRFNDFYVSIDVKADKTYKRDGVDLYLDRQIPLSIAILGGVVQVPTIDGEVNIRIQPGTQSGTLVRLRGRGVPYLQSGGRGDQYIRIIVNLPSKLNPKQKELLKKFEEAGRKKNWNY